ncbi:MAG: AtpZ/AtpI family protein [Clostridiaceae bacterium]|nr:AtpZ/AtpI family protein [Clostridiaceae bacterium]
MKDRKVLRSFVMISQIGITMLVPIFLCTAIGVWLNRQFDNVYLFLLMLLIGIGAAFRSLFILTKSFYEKDMKREHEQTAYLEGLKTYRQKHPDEDFSDVMEGKKKRYPEHKNPHF